MATAPYPHEPSATSAAIRTALASQMTPSPIGNRINARGNRSRPRATHRYAPVRSRTRPMPSYPEHCGPIQTWKRDVPKSNVSGR